MRMDDKFWQVFVCFTYVVNCHCNPKNSTPLSENSFRQESWCQGSASCIQGSAYYYTIKSYLQDKAGNFFGRRKSVATVPDHKFIIRWFPPWKTKSKHAAPRHCWRCFFDRIGTTQINQCMLRCKYLKKLAFMGLHRFLRTQPAIIDFFRSHQGYIQVGSTLGKSLLRSPRIGTNLVWAWWATINFV